ncbi:MAG: hypothetical protein E6Q97_19050 [Desulfurellales bacterium]|nr:MAG: hypothetical protein E6Q97_19050 [Desulfurellales bacterium]
MNTNATNEADFPQTPAARWVYLVIYFDDGHPCAEAYINIGHAERAKSHAIKAGFNARIETRAIRGETYLSMIGA